jgi:glycerol-3-phosphate acyltransferase PlsY
VATSLGVIFGMMPLAALTIFAIWGIVFKVSRYVSLASITAAASLPVVVILLMTWYPRYAWGAVYGWGNFFFAAAATFLVIKRHTGNIRRLMDGTELRFGTPKPADPAVGATTPAVGAAGAARAEAVGDGGHRALDAKGSASVDPVATKAEPTQDTPPQV